VSLVLAALTVGALSTAAPATAAAPDTWTASLGDSGNSTNNPGETTITAATASRVGGSWTAATHSSSPSAPLVVNGYALRVVSPNSVGGPSYLTATSPSDGSTLWTVSLPGEAQYNTGLAVSGSRVLVPFDGWQGPGGVIAVDLTSRSVVWTTHLPPASTTWSGNAVTGAAYTDGQRVYVSGAGNPVNAYRLTDGALLWSLPYNHYDTGALKKVDGFAVGTGVVYTGGDEGILAYDGATGRLLWTGQWAAGLPVVAGGRVFGTEYGKVVAFPAGGCGRATCTPLWSTVTDPTGSTQPTLAGADGTTLFATWGAHVMRLSAATGAIQWSTLVGSYVAGLVRAADAIWFNDEYVRADGTVDQRIAAFSAQATGDQPLRFIPLSRDRVGFPQQLAVAAGTLFQQTNGGSLAGYRVGAPANAAPTATFDYNTSGLTVNVNAGASTDVNGLIDALAWTFGDGGTATGWMTNHTYAAAGTYTVTLTVTDDGGASTSTSRSVTVTAPAPTPPPASGPFASDAFGRTVAGGLGTADVGGPWSISGSTANVAVNNGSGALTMRRPGTQVSAWLGATTHSDTDLRLHLSVDKRPTGSGAYVDVVGRRVALNDEYRARLILGSNGRVAVALTALKGSATAQTLASAVLLPSSVTLGPGTGLQVRLQVVGTSPSTVRVKVWTTGTAEPTAWQRTATDSSPGLQAAGAVGLTTYLSGSATNAPVVLRMDDLSAQPTG